MSFGAQWCSHPSPPDPGVPGVCRVGCMYPPVVVGPWLLQVCWWAGVVPDQLAVEAWLWLLQMPWWAGLVPWLSMRPGCDYYGHAGGQGWLDLAGWEVWQWLLQACWCAGLASWKGRWLGGVLLPAEATCWVRWGWPPREGAALGGHWCQLPLSFISFKNVFQLLNLD